MEREVTQHAGHGLKLCQQWEGSGTGLTVPVPYLPLPSSSQQQVCKAGTLPFSPAPPKSCLCGLKSVSSSRWHQSKAKEWSHDPPSGSGTGSAAQSSAWEG